MLNPCIILKKRRFDVYEGKSVGCFYGSDGLNIFSNYWNEKIVIPPIPGISVHRVEGDSIEHVYQRAKFPINVSQFDVLYAGYHQRMGTGDAAKRAANDLKADVRKDWMAVNEHIMRQILAVKFLPGTLARQILDSTVGMYLVEHTKRDSFWGDGGDGSGKNRLGHILMQIRGDVVHVPDEYKNWLKGLGQGAKCFCGRDVWTDPSGRTVSEYCSIKCRDAKKHMVTRKCFCGKDVWTDPSGKSVSQFCSIRCREAMKQKQVPVAPIVVHRAPVIHVNVNHNICLRSGCGKNVWIDPTRQTVSQFCSIGCRRIVTGK